MTTRFAVVLAVLLGAAHASFAADPPASPPDAYGGRRRELALA